MSLKSGDRPEELRLELEKIEARWKLRLAKESLFLMLAGISSILLGLALACSLEHPSSRKAKVAVVVAAAATFAAEWGLAAATLATGLSCDNPDKRTDDEDIP